MKQLTQEQAERCARALGWERIQRDNPFIQGAPTERDYCWGIVLRGSTTGSLVEYEWKSDDSVTLDPYFWFPRLWDALNGEVQKANPHAGFGGTWFDVYQDESGTQVRINQAEPCDEPDASDNHPCLALCAAIDAEKARFRNELPIKG